LLGAGDGCLDEEGSPSYALASSGSMSRDRLEQGQEEGRVEPKRPRRRPDLLPALVGFAGVLIGSLTTAGLTYLGDRNHRHANERAATRVVVLEIQRDQLALAAMYETGGITLGQPLSAQTWAQQQSELARSLNSREWNAISNFYGHMAFLNQAITPGRCARPELRDYALQSVEEGNSVIHVLGHGVITPDPQTWTPCKPGSKVSNLPPVVEVPRPPLPKADG
jgi:hypothetical protein